MLKMEKCEHEEFNGICFWCGKEMPRKGNESEYEYKYDDKDDQEEDAQDVFW